MKWKFLNHVLNLQESNQTMDLNLSSKKLPVIYPDNINAKLLMNWEKLRLVRNLLLIVSIYTSYLSFLSKIPPLGKPRFIKHLKDTTVDEGATLHLEVEVEACPEPTVKWLQNGREVSADARIKITRDSHRNETYHLAVDLIKYEEQGEYEVIVTNSLGTVSSKSTVTVQSKFIIIHSSFIIQVVKYKTVNICKYGLNFYYFWITGIYNCNKYF